MNRITKILYLFWVLIILSCAKLSYYSLEDVEKQRLKFMDGEKKALKMLTEIYQDRNQSYDVRLAALRALSESRDLNVIQSMQSSVSNASLIELDLMKEAIEILISYKDPASNDSLVLALKSTETKSLEIRKSILNAIGENGTENQVKLLVQLYDVSKRSNIQMNQLLTNTLGKIGDESVIPILMEIARNKKLPVNIRSQSVEILSKKNAPELVDFFIEMLGDPASRDKVNEYALNVMGEFSEERMILALIEAYQVGRHEYYSLLNTIMNGLNNFENSEIKYVYKEIASTVEFPGKIRLKAFKGLSQFADDPEIIEEMISLLNKPQNYIYYNEIINMLYDFGVYEKFKNELRMAAFKAMQKNNLSIEND